MNKKGMKYSIIVGCVGIFILLIVIGNKGTKNSLILGQYTGFEVDVTEVKVTDKDVESALIDAVTASQENVDITNRAVRKGDVVNIDYVGSVDGVEFDYGSDTDYDLEIGSNTFINGFEEQIIGMTVGKTADITVTFPEVYLNNPDLAGAEAVFTITLNSISGKVIPDKITDTMIVEISDTYTTVEDYREYIKGELEVSAENTNLQNNYNAVWSLVEKDATIYSLSSKKIKYYSTLFEKNYQYYADTYGVSLNEFITNYMEMTVAEFNEEKKAYAEEYTKMYAISELIAKEEGISVSDDEYQEYLTDYGMSADEEKSYKEAIKDELLYKKVIEFIASKTTFTVVS